MTTIQLEVGKKYNAPSGTIYEVLFIDGNVAFCKCNGGHANLCTPNTALREFREPLIVDGWANVYPNSIYYYKTKEDAHRLCNPRDLIATVHLTGRHDFT